MAESIKDSLVSSTSQGNNLSHQISSVFEKTSSQVERGLQQSLVALATQDANNTDVDEYVKKKSILQTESQANVSGQKHGVQDSTKNKQNTRSIKTIKESNEGHGTQSRRNETIEVKFGDSDEQEDELDIALRRVREIPLEQYLGIEKAEKVKEARKVKQEKVERNRGKSDVNLSRQAGSYVQTDWLELSEAEKVRRVDEQNKLIAQVNTNDEFATRMQNITNQKNQPIEERFVNKRRHAKRWLKLKRAKVPIEEMDKISAWSMSDAYPNIEPLITRKLQYACHVCKRGATSVNVKALGKQHDLKLENPSKIPQIDARSAHLSGMIVRKSKGQQTMTQYDLIPEIVYNSIEIKVRDLLHNLIVPTRDRQLELGRQHQELYMLSQKFDTKLRDCQLGIKKQLNVKDQFDQVNARIEAQNLILKKMDSTLVKLISDSAAQNDKTQASIRVLTSDVKATSKFINKKNDDSAKMQVVISSFKDRLMEKYAVLADEYTEAFKKIEHRHLTLMETITSIVRRFDGLSQEQVALKVDFLKDVSELDTVKEAVNGLKSCYKFGPRITLLENQAKSDLIAVTKKYNEMLYENRRNMKRTEALKLIYSMQVDMANAMLDPVKHRSGLKPSHEHPKLATEVQAKINLLEWQINFNKDGPFEEKNVINTMNHYQNEALNTKTKQMRRNILLLQLNSQKIGRKIERATTMPQNLLKRQEFPPFPMPPEKRINVDLNKVNVNTATIKSIASPKNSSVHSNQAKGKVKRRAKMTFKDTLRLNRIKQISQPGKIRQIVRLSKLRRSNSSKPLHRVKPTIENLINDPSRPSFLHRLKTTMKSTLSNDSKRVEPKPSHQRPKRPMRDRKTVSKDKDPIKKQTKSKSPKRRGSSRLKAPQSDYQQLTSSNINVPTHYHRAEHPPTPLVVDQIRISSLSPNEPYSPEPVSPPTGNAGNLLFTVLEETKSQNNQQGVLEFAEAGATSPSAFSPASTSQNITGGVQKMMGGVSKMMSSYYSQQTSQSEEIASALYDEFVPRDEFENQLEDIRTEMREQIMMETRHLIAETTTQLVEENTEMINQAQISIGEVLQEQLHTSQESLKTYIGNEVARVNQIVDKIQKDILPSTIAKINASLEEARQSTKESLKQNTSWVESQIKNFSEKVDNFESEVQVVMTKFKRLVSDQDIFKARVEKIQKRTQEMVKVMRSEQLANSKITSTLVELEFVQQSLDFQDEFDKTQMNLYGLNDLNMTLEEFIAKSSEIASRKLRHEAMMKATELELAQIGESARQNLTDLTDSGTYQAITMGDDWPSHLGNENFKKQILQAFKLACVYYKPSPVIYRGHSYNRRSLIEAKRQILDADWQMLSKFQPFKRLWGEDSGVDFYEQFATKIRTLIKGFEKGADMTKFTAQLAEDTFVKIYEGTNINQLKQRRENSFDEDLLSSDQDLNDGHRMKAARETDYPLNMSSRIHITDDQATQSSNKRKINKSQDTREMSKLQNSARNHRGIDVISNRKKKSPEGGVNTIESKTRSMIEAIQGKSVFGPSFEESIFSSEAEKTNLPKMTKNTSAGQNKNKRQHNRSVQKNENQNEVGIFGEFLHAPFWMNQSQVIYENHQQSYLASDSGAGRQKASELNQRGQITAQIRRKTSPKSLSRNERKAQYITEKSPRQRDQIMSTDNPNMFQMRPLIGKEQFRKSQSKLVSQGTNSMDRERETGNGNDYDMRLVKGSTKVNKFSMSPWSRPGQLGQSRQPDLNPSRLSIEMKVVGINKDIEFSKVGRNQGETFQKTSETVQQKTLNFPLNLPIQTINMSLNSPITSNESYKGQTSAGSQSVLTLPKVRNQVRQKQGEPALQLPLSGNLGSGQPTSQSYESLVESSRFNMKSAERKEKKKYPNKMVELTKQNDGVVSSTSLLWTHEDDMGNKMQAKLVPTSSNPSLDNTAINMQKLREIARQKKQILVHVEQTPNATRE